RLFQLHQTRIGMQAPSINSSVSALRFFFTVTLDRPDLSRRLTVVPQPRRIPAGLSGEEVTLLLRAASAPKYKAAFATAYGAGLRVSEVVALKVGDIDSERMLLRVERGKGRKDRHANGAPAPGKRRGDPADPRPLGEADPARERLKGGNAVAAAAGCSARERQSAGEEKRRHRARRRRPRVLSVQVSAEPSKRGQAESSLMEPLVSL